jgi:hypothetical protein
MHYEKVTDKSRNVNGQIADEKQSVSIVILLLVLTLVATSFYLGGV